MKIRAKNDATGHATWDAYNGRWAFEVVEREDGYILGGLVTQYLAGYSKWQSHEKRAMRFVKGRVLDVGCGAGRHALYLQGKGFDVTAIDVSPLLIRIAKLKGVKKARLWSIAELSKFQTASFDTVLLLGNNFGLLENRLKVGRILGLLHKVTPKNGRIIAESSDPYHRKDKANLEYRRMNQQRGRFAGQRRIRIRYREFTSNWFDYLGVSKSEMEMLLHGTGWRLKTTIDSAGSSFIAIIEKHNGVQPSSPGEVATRAAPEK